MLLDIGRDRIPTYLPTATRTTSTGCFRGVRSCARTRAHASQLGRSAPAGGWPRVGFGRILSGCGRTKAEPELPNTMQCGAVASRSACGTDDRPSRALWGRIQPRLSMRVRVATPTRDEALISSARGSALGRAGPKVWVIRQWGGGQICLDLGPNCTEICRICRGP